MARPRVGDEDLVAGVVKELLVPSLKVWQVEQVLDSPTLQAN